MTSFFGTRHFPLVNKYSYTLVEPTIARIYSSTINGTSLAYNNTTTTTTKPLIPNKLGYARNEIQSENIRSKISNISDNNEYDERKRK
jgi:hypothetical protein